MSAHDTPLETARDVPAYLADDAALDAFIAAWRAGTLPKPAWTHPAHVAVCAYHAWAGVPLDTVFAAMKARRTTRLDAVRSAVTAFGQARNLHGRHYGFDVVRDRTARASWVAPDLVTKQDK